MEKAYIRTEVRHKKFQFTSRHDSFTTKYDSVQKQLGELAVMDDLMSGMLSKSMGQILRVGLGLHVLFHLEDEPGTLLSENISELAIDAAIDFVEVCCQQTAFIAGRGTIDI
jgi:hypothetical protein